MSLNGPTFCGCLSCSYKLNTYSRAWGDLLLDHQGLQSDSINEITLVVVGNWVSAAVVHVKGLLEQQVPKRPETPFINIHTFTLDSTSEAWIMRQNPWNADPVTHIWSNTCSPRPDLPLPSSSSPSPSTSRRAPARWLWSKPAGERPAQCVCE